MDWVTRINAVMDYIEENLDREIDPNAVARIGGCSIYNFQRMFSYIADCPLSEYIRNRRLTQAAFSLTRGEGRIIDVALRYGYDSNEAFSRAFQRFHGVLPSKVRTETVPLKSCPKLSFQISIKGVQNMNYQIEKWPAFTVAGYETKVRTDEAFTIVPKLWADAQSNGTFPALIEVLQKADSRPSGVLGIAFGGHWGGNETTEYLMGVTVYVDAPGSKRTPIPDGMKGREIPAATWAIIQCEGELPSSVQDVYKEFYTGWLPNKNFVYWSYTNLKDERLAFSDEILNSKNPILLKI